MAESTGVAAVYRRPRGTLAPLDDSSSLIGRIARRDASFSEMWQEARRLEIVRDTVDTAGDRNMAGRLRERMRIIAEEATMFDSDSDTDGGGSGSDSDGDGDGDSEDNAEEDILAKQAREREQAAADVTSAVLGAMVALLAKEIARDAIGTSAPKNGIIGRVNTYYSYNAAIDAAEDAAEAEEQKKALAAAASQGGDVDEPRLHLPPIEQSSSNGSSTGDGQRPKSPPPRPRSASRHIISGRPSRSDGWHLG
ncbi:unnamed protein product [Ectocarpus sp. 12 AP-2014]